MTIEQFKLRYGYEKLVCECQHVELMHGVTGCYACVRCVRFNAKFNQPEHPNELKQRRANAL